MSSSVELVRDALAWIASQWDENRVYIRSVTGGREHVLVELMASDGSYWAIRYGSYCGRVEQADHHGYEPESEYVWRTLVERGVPV